MKYLSRLLVIASVTIGFAACADQSEIIDPNGSQPGDMKVNISFEMPQVSPHTRSMVSGTENRVHTMQMVCFDANGLYLGIRKADSVTPSATVDVGTIKGTVPQGTARIHFIANRNLTMPLSHTVGTQEETVMKSVELSTLYSDEDHQEVCYWGYHKEASESAMQGWLAPIAPNQSRVYMIRDRAKVVLTYDPDGALVPVTKIEWLIHNGRDRGYLAPKSSEWENYYGNSTVAGHTDELISIATMNEYTTSGRYSLWRSDTDNEDGNFDVAYQSTGTYTSQPQFLFDDDNTDIDDVKVILKVTYTVSGSPKTVYHTLRLNDDNKVKYDIVRNNTYYIKCKLLSPDVAYYETLKEAIDGNEFVNADVEIDRSITDINDDNYTLQILLPTETTSIVLNTEGEHTMDFAFRMASDVTQAGSTNPADFEVTWEKSQTFCSDPTVTYNSETMQFTIHTTVIEGKLTSQLQDEWIVVKHKTTGLTRYIHVFVIDQFRYKIHPKLKASGSDYVLTFQIPPMEHSKYIQNPDNPTDPNDTIPDPTELVYPESLYPIEVKFATNTLKAYGITSGTNNYGLFGVSLESTEQLLDAANFEEGDGTEANPAYNDPISSTATSNITHWYYQQETKHWDYWYTYSLKTYPTGGQVSIYFKDVRDNIKYATVADVGLFLYVEYFGKNYSVPVTQ